MYQHVATSIAGFIQQVAVGYVCRGYFFYVCGVIPESKNPSKTDEKIINQYGIAISKFTRSRQRRTGAAGIQYLRHGRFFVILATKGTHPFFQQEQNNIEDIRRTPLQFCGHSIGCVEHDKKMRPSVRIARNRFKELKSEFTANAVHRSLGELERDFNRLPFEPFAPVRGQLLMLLRAVNRLRKTASLPLVPFSALRLHRKPVKPFD